MNLRSKYIFNVFPLILLLLTVLEVFLAISNKGTNAAEAAKICDHVISNYDFTVKSKSSPGKPAFGWAPGVKGFFLTKPHVMISYGIIEKKEQDAIAAIIKNFMVNNNTSSVVIKFYKEENWQTPDSIDGKSSDGSRGPEELIREIKI